MEQVEYAYTHTEAVIFASRPDDQHNLPAVFN